MPCWEVNTVSVEFHAKHVALLEKAFESLDWVRDLYWNADKSLCRLPNGIELDLRAGRAECPVSQQPRLNELKRAYSKQAIKLAAKLGGWQNQNLTQTKGNLLRGVM